MVKNIKNIFFDLGGVLFSNGSLIARHKLITDCLIEEAIANEILFGPTSWNLRRGELTMSEYWSYILSKYPKLERSPYEIEKLWFDSYEIDFNMVNRIKKLGKNYSLGTISGNIKERIDYLDNKYSFRKLFTFEIYSCDVGIDKNDKQIFKYAIDIYNLFPEVCLLIDDNDDCLDAAASIGFQCIKYNNIEELIFKLSKYTI